MSGGSWLLAIAAAAAGAWLRWIAPIAIFVLYLVLHTTSGHSAIHVGGSAVILIAVLVVGGFAGWHLGGRTILRHIGEREYRGRIVVAKGISGFWRWWFRDPV